MTGFRIKSPVAKVFADMRNIRASDFAPDVQQFLKRSLTTALQLTPARNLSTIQTAQRKQYAHRINYIPSFHELLDPTLIVKADGSQWLYSGGKWYRPDAWKLPNQQWADYQVLLAERDRRMQTARDTFVDERAQARFLYKHSWWEVGQSVGIDVPCSQDVKDAHSRHNPAKAPPKGYAQNRGGESVFSIVVYNPFLEQDSEYKPFSGKAILAQAMQQHRAKFDKDVAERQTRELLKILAEL